ncbi:MAG: DUF58 domain-containing protein [Candidatus Hinthialibacter antarcticus]|nr:DUF58 domain-containing protein [Candidatus Hinthialibacter antarcticus]
MADPQTANETVEPTEAPAPPSDINDKGLMDASFLKYLEQLALVSRKTFLGRLKGERRSRKRGVSIEFADYRDYSKGDDLRFLDWNIFGRLDRLFTKLFHEEEDLYLYILVDSSKSMDTGDPNKGVFAKRMAAALAYITLAGMDRVCLVGFGKERYRWMQPARGKGSIWRILNFLEELPMDGETTLADGCKRFMMQQKQGGIVILLSDLFDPEGCEDAVKQLLQKQNDVYLLQTLSPQELNPDLVGALRLLDVETNEPVEISVTEELLGVYERRMKAFQADVRDFSLRYGMHYLPLSSDAPVERLLTDAFRRLGLVA